MKKLFAARRLVGVAVLAAVAAGITLATPSPALAVPPTWERIQNYGTWAAAHVDTIGANAAVRQRTYNNSTSGQWNAIQVNGVVDTYRFQNRYSGMCMTVGGSRLNLAPIVQTLCASNDPLQWWIRVEEPDDPAYRIYNAFTGFVLSANYGAFFEGVAMYQTRYVRDDTSQQWQMW
jgi:hypothetical protein